MTVSESINSAPMKIVFAGTPEPAAVVLEHLVSDPRFEVLGVVTQPDAKRGRGRTVHPSKVAEVAHAHGIDVAKWPSLKSDSPSGPLVRAQLRVWREAGASAVAVVAYGNLIPADLLTAFTHGWINLHFSRLPKWRGAAPVQAAIAAGDGTTGASIFRIEEGLDTGPVVAMNEEPIGLRDTADDVLTRLTYSGRQLLADALQDLHHGRAELTEQDSHWATHAAKISSQDARIDWAQDARVIQRTARAHTPAPGAWSVLNGQRYKFGMLALTESALAESPVEGGQRGEIGIDLSSVPPGRLVVSRSRVFVGTGTQPLEVERIQPPGKKMMIAADWARGQRELIESEPMFESPVSSGANSTPTTASPAGTSKEH